MERDARDRIAEMVGLHYVKSVRCWYSHPSLEEEHFVCDDPRHPIPASLDFVSAAWPDGVSWHKHTYWNGGGRYASLTQPTKFDAGREFTSVNISDTDDELADRFELLARTLEWLRDNDQPAFAAACEKVRKAMEKQR